jgi:hypothetical protein
MRDAPTSDRPTGTSSMGRGCGVDVHAERSRVRGRTRRQATQRAPKPPIRARQRDGKARRQVERRRHAGLAQASAAEVLVRGTAGAGVCASCRSGFVWGPIVERGAEICVTARRVGRRGRDVNLEIRVPPEDMGQDRMGLPWEKVRGFEIGEPNVTSRSMTPPR